VRDLDILAAPLHGEEVGIIRDRRANTYTAVLAVRVRSFGLLDREEQERRLSGWGHVLAGLSREQSPIRRLQWVERTVPADGDQIARYLQEERDTTVPLATSSVASYIELVEAAGAVTQDHELFLALQLDARKAWRQIKRLGRGDEGAIALLLRELETLAERLTGVDVQVQGALRPRMTRMDGPIATGSPPLTHTPGARVCPPARRGRWPQMPRGAHTAPIRLCTRRIGSRSGRGSTWELLSSRRF
jgi:hypothetical protein